MMRFNTGRYPGPSETTTLEDLLAERRAMVVQANGRGLAEDRVARYDELEDQIAAARRPVDLISRPCPLVAEGKEIHYCERDHEKTEITELIDLVPAILAKISHVEEHAARISQGLGLVKSPVLAVLRTCQLNRDIISRCITNRDRTACEVLRDIALCWGVIP